MKISAYVIVIIFFVSSLSFAQSKKNIGKTNKIQRTSFGFIDFQRSTVSNFDFHSSNHGIIGLDVQGNDGFWPRGSKNMYLYGSGFWFGALKRHEPSGELRKLVELSYNPWNGKSWMIPGRIEEGDTSDTSDEKTYRIYFSTDFDETGVAINPEDGPNWPLWDTNPKRSIGQGYYGDFVLDAEQRNPNSHSKGPAFISDEDIFCTYKDTDLRRYDKGEVISREEGYPLRLQYNQTIYSWGSGIMKDQIIVRYDISSFSDDTLWNCWFAPVIDPDIARLENLQGGCRNDRIGYHFENDSVKFVYAWTEGNQGEHGYGFGYMGISMISTPATDEFDFLRQDRITYSKDEQLGLETFHNWQISEELGEREDRYNLMSDGIIENDEDPGDKRMIMATGPFHLLPGEKTSIMILFTFAEPSVEIDANGTKEDLAGLISKITQGQEFFSSLKVGVDQESTKGDILESGIAYPNPINGKATIMFNNPTSENVEVSICNIFGKQIELIHSGWLSMGQQEFSFESNKLQSGLYFCRISTNDGSIVIKLIKR